MRETWHERPVQVAPSRSVHELWAHLVLLETALTTLDSAAGPAPDLAIARAALSVGLAASELESAFAQVGGHVPPKDLGASPGDHEDARHLVCDALSAVVAQAERSLTACDGSARQLAALTRALVHLREAEAALASRP